MRVPPECKAHDLKKGVGVTIYHFVEDIDTVSFDHTQLFLLVSRLIFK